MGVTILLLLYAVYTWHLFYPTTAAGATSWDWPLGAPITGLIVLAWFLIVVRIVHQHPLTDRESYWRTRPIPATLLLPAKLAAALLICSFPVLLLQGIAVLGFSLLRPDLAQLLPALTAHALYWVMFLLPFLALASLTRTATSAFFVGVGFFVALFLGMMVFQEVMGFGGGPHQPSLSAWLFWIPLTVTNVTVLLLQFFSRRTYLAWAATGVLVFFISFLLPLGLFDFTIRLPESNAVYSTGATVTSLNMIPLGRLQKVDETYGVSHYSLPFSWDKHQSSILVPTDGALSLFERDAEKQVLHVPLVNGISDRRSRDRDRQSGMLNYLVKVGTSHLVLTIRDSDLPVEFGPHHKLVVWMSGSIHPPPLARPQRLTDAFFDLSTGVRCRGREHPFYAVDLQCFSAFSEVPNALATVGDEESAISLPLYSQSRLLRAASFNVGSTPILNPLRMTQLVDAKDLTSDLPMPPMRRHLRGKETYVVPLERGDHFSASLVLENVTLEHVAKRAP